MNDCLCPGVAFLDNSSLLTEMARFVDHFQHLYWVIPPE